MCYARLIFLTSLLLVNSRLLSQYSFKNFLNLSGKKDVAFKCVREDKYGILWLGTQEGLLRFDGKKTEDFRKEFNYRDLKISAVLPDTNGSVLIGTENGRLYLLKKNGQADSLSLGEHAPSSKITAIFKSASGKLFIGTYGDGIYIIEKDRVIPFSANNGLSDDVIYNILFFQNKLWCGTDAGISIISNIESAPSCEILSQKNGLP